MRAQKIDGSLAIMLSEDAIDALHLQESDDLTLGVVSSRTLQLSRPMTENEKDEALERLRRLARPMPAGWRFSREEANERGE